MTTTHTSILVMALLLASGCGSDQRINKLDDTANPPRGYDKEPLDDLQPNGGLDVKPWDDDPNDPGPNDTGDPEPCPDPGYFKPGASNTGPYDESVLQDSSSITITEDGAVIEDLHVRGMIKVKANDVTLRNVIVDCADSTWYGIQTFHDYSGAIIDHVEVKNCKSAGIYGPNFHGSYLEIHEMWGDAVKARDNVTLEFSWIHHLGKNEGSHADGNQTRTGSNILLRANFFDMPIPESDSGPGGPYKSNATSINSTELGDIDNFVMEGNWLNGGNYTVYFGGSTETSDDDFVLSNSALTGNRFGRDYRYGVLSTRGNIENLDVSCNRWDDTDELMDINGAD